MNTRMVLFFIFLVCTCACVFKSNCDPPSTNFKELVMRSGGTWRDAPLPILYINLERRKDRLTDITKMLSGYPNTAMVKRIDAVEGRDLLDETIFLGCKLKNRGEKGCFLSHVKAWKAVLKAKIDTALILEDDVVLDYECQMPILQNLVDVANAQGAWDVIALGYLNIYQNYFQTTNLKIDNSHVLGYLKNNHYLPSGMAYVIKKSTIRKLLLNLSRGKGVCNPVDHYISDEIHKNKIYAIVPPLFTQTGVTSDIQPHSTID